MIDEDFGPSRTGGEKKTVEGAVSAVGTDSWPSESKEAASRPSTDREF